MRQRMSVVEFLGSNMRAVNVGLPLFADALREQGVEVVQVKWRPPAGGDADLIRVLDGLRSSVSREKGGLHE